MILEILTVPAARAGDVGSTREQNEARSPVGIIVTNDHQRLRTHGVPCGQVGGEKLKRVDAVQFLRRDRHRPVLLTGKRFGERPPRRADVVGVGRQHLAHVGPDTVDVNMQLVLGPRVSGVHGEAQPVPGQFAPCALFDEDDPVL